MDSAIRRTHTVPLLPHESTPCLHLASFHHVFFRVKENRKYVYVSIPSTPLGRKAFSTQSRPAGALTLGIFSHCSNCIPAQFIPLHLSLILPHLGCFSLFLDLYMILNPSVPRLSASAPPLSADGNRIHREELVGRGSEISWVSVRDFVALGLIPRGLFHARVWIFSVLEM